MNSRCLAAIVTLSFVAAGCSATKPDCQGTAQVCNGVCVELKSDNLNCGACGTACGGGQVCSNGACTVTCGAGLLNCNGHCIDPSTDRAHCGASGACTGGTAGAACGDGQLCSTGQCVQTCSAPQAACPSTSPTYCADTRTDSKNCGGCGVVCAAGQQCSSSGGTTACACPSSTPDACGSGAGAFCTNRQNDPQNCGACGTSCGAGQVCSGGSCVQNCAAGEPTACPAGAPTYCADTTRDANNCGGCGLACPAGQQCSAGVCSCPAPTPDACTTGSGQSFCTSTMTDGSNCGACGNACKAGETCDGTGHCLAVCPAPLVRCGGSCIDPHTDTAHCGASGDCTGVATGSVCLNGRTCSAARCEPAWQPISATGAPAARSRHAAASLGALFQVFGGTLTGTVALADGGAYDPATDSWSALPPLGAARCAHAAASTGTVIYAFGGLTDCLNGFTVGPGLEVFDGTGWSAIVAVGAPSFRYNFPMTWTGSELFLYGGASDLGPALSTGARFDPVTKSWIDASCGLPDCQRGGYYSTFLDGTSIRLWGGGPYGSAPQGLQYDLVSGTWNAWATPAGTPADIPPSGSTAADDGQRIFVLSGAADCSGSVQVQIFDRRTGQWVVDPALAPAGLSGFAATAWVGGELIAWSGQCAGGASAVGGRYQPPPPTP